MDAGKRTISEIFTGNKMLEVPFFQRAYVWKEENWERFLEDLEYVSSSRMPYFMGSLILKQQMTGSNSAVGDVRLVIDGQQRLTTICILMKVLSLKAGKSNKFSRSFMLDNDEPVLLHNRDDHKAFDRIMKLTQLDDLQGKDKITDAYRYFVKNADPEKLDYDAICYKVLFVGIDLDQDDDEQQIFDTINSLGVTLTTAELLKNYFFTRRDEAAYMQNWWEIFEKDEETRSYWDTEITTGRTKRTYIDMFFYSFLLIKIQDSAYKLSTEEKIKYSKFERLFESYKAFIKDKCNDDRISILKEIKEYASAFRKAINRDVIYGELTPDAGIDRINMIIFTFDTTTLIPYVLFIEKNVQDESLKNDLYDALESYLLRRIVTRQTTKNYNRMFSERLIYNNVLSKDEFVRHIAESDDVNNRMPMDSEVEDAFHTSVLVNKYAAGVLYLIESKIRDRRMHSTGLLGVEKYSLEHLMPKKWVNNWRKDGEVINEDRRNWILLTLGNLAIITTTLNSAIRDSDWHTKKEGTANKNGLRKYSEGIETLSPYLELDEWNEDRIYERASDLAEKALKIWKA